MRGDLERVLFDEPAINRRLDEMAAQIQQGVAVEGQLVPARAVTQMESTVAPPIPSQLSPYY